MRYGGLALRVVLGVRKSSEESARTVLSSSSLASLCPACKVVVVRSMRILVKGRKRDGKRKNNNK